MAIEKCSAKVRSGVISVITIDAWIVERRYAERQPMAEDRRFDRHLCDGAWSVGIAGVLRSGDVSQDVYRLDCRLVVWGDKKGNGFCFSQRILLDALLRIRADHSPHL